MAKDRRQDLTKATGKPLTKRKANVETSSGITPGFTPGSGLFDFMTPTVAAKEDTAAKRADTALVCVVNGHMLIVREKWWNWDFAGNTCDHTFGDRRHELQDEREHLAHESTGAGGDKQESAPGSGTEGREGI